MQPENELGGVFFCAFTHSEYTYGTHITPCNAFFQEQTLKTKIFFEYIKLYVIVLICLSFLQELSKHAEAMTVQAENLVKNSSEIHLGSKNKQSLQQQAKSIQEQVKKVEVTLEEEYVLNKS